MHRILLLTILLGGYCTLAAQDFTSTGALTNANGGVTTVDLNNDSFPDIVFLQRASFTQESNRLIREINNGEDLLDFTEIEFITANEISGRPAAADFDQDGNVDILFSGLGESNLLLFNADESGNLTETMLATEGAAVLITANLNGDDFPDLVGLNFAEDEVVAYINNDGTGFNRTTIYSTGIVPFSHHVTDIDGDGDDDVVIGTDGAFTEQSLVLLINNGTGTFTTQVIESTGSVVRSVDDISSGDLNGDDRIDLLVVSSFNCYSYLQNDDASFSRTEELFSSSPFRSVEIGDFNGDGKEDFIIGDNSDVGIVLYLNDGMTVPGFSGSEISMVRPAFSLSAQDMNKDGDLDFVASNGEVYAFENNIDQVSSINTSPVVVRDASIFPNPVGEGFISLKGESLSVTNSYELIDGAGKLVRKGQLDSRGQIDMRNTPPGIYIIRLFEGEAIWARSKVVKM